MRISMTGTGPNDGGVLVPIDPPPPTDINDFFELELLRATPMEVKPFERVEVAWRIKPKAGTDVSRFVLSVIAGGQELATSIDNNGIVGFEPSRSTSVRVIGRTRGGSASSTLGQSMVVTVNEDGCHIMEIASSIVDGQVTQYLSRLTSSTAELRLRSALVGLVPVQLEPTSTWELGVVKYHFPLEVVINNFFDADLDVDLEIRFAVTHQGAATDLDVSIEHTSNVDFDTVENILSLGNASTAAKTANRLLPLVLDCRVSVLEREIVRMLLSVIESWLDTHRLLYVRVVPAPDGFSYLAIALCPLPGSPVPDEPVIDPVIHH